MGEIVDESAANGILLIVHSLTNDSDVQYITKQAEWNNFSINATGVPGTKYSISVFALEDGLPFPRVVTSPQDVSVATNSDNGLWMHNVP